MTNYAEASYFDGYHFQHIADHNEKKRIERLTRRSAGCIRRLCGAGRPQGHIKRSTMSVE